MTRGMIVLELLSSERIEEASVEWTEDEVKEVEKEDGGKGITPGAWYKSLWTDSMFN